MHIIPVIDLLHGKVVRAAGGQRAQYAPCASPLSRDADPVSVLHAMLALYPFAVVYLADLNAILHTDDNQPIIERLLAEFPLQSFWLDTGRDVPFSPHPRLRTVIGTESGVTCAALRAFDEASPDHVLSLDFNAAGLIGDGNILDEPEHWPRDVIVMHLPSIGTGAGPALPLARSLRVRAQRTRFHLAGGIGSVSDLTQARAAGMAGVLIATLLHEGRVSSEEIQEIEQDPE